MKKNREKIFLVVIFSIFTVFLIFQHQFLYLCHDDYGYGALQYVEGVTTDVKGTDYSFFRIFEFLKGHYINWGGRIVAFFFEIVILHYFNLQGFRIIQSLIILGIFILIYKILRKCLDEKINSPLIALVTVILYGVTELGTFNHGFFWISASVAYVFPIFFLFLFIYQYSFARNENQSLLKKILKNIIITISIFLATFSQEQIAVASLTYILSFTIYHIVKNKKINKLDIFFSIISIISFLTLILAPGNEIRKQHPSNSGYYQLPFLQQIKIGILNTIEGNFNENNKIFSYLFFGTTILFGIKNLKKDIGFKKLNVLSLISVYGIFLLTFIKPQGYFKFLIYFSENNLYKIGIIVITLLQLCLIAYTITIYLWNRNLKELVVLFWAGILSQGGMIITAFFPLRASIIFEYIYYIIAILILGDVYLEKNIKEIVICSVVPFLLFCILNIVRITNGYLENSKINKENEKKLTTASRQIKNGEDVDKIILKKLPNVLYCGEQPYMDGYDYILGWMKEYYNLPSEIDIQYEK